MRFTLAMLIGATFLVGCQHAKPGRASGDAEKPARAPGAKKARAIPSAATANAPRAMPVVESRGKVAAVNASLRFVVIEFSLTQLPQVGERMNVYRQGLKVGEVRISGPARDRNIAADITVGDAQVGDEIRND